MHGVKGFVSVNFKSPASYDQVQSVWKVGQTSRSQGQKLQYGVKVFWQAIHVKYDFLFWFIR